MKTPKQSCVNRNAETCQHGPGCEDLALVVEALSFLALEFQEEGHIQEELRLRHATHVVQRTLRARAENLEFKDVQ